MPQAHGRFSATITSGDYRVTRAWVEIAIGEAFFGKVNLERIRARLAGNTVDAEIGIYQRPSGGTLPSTALLATSEEFVDTTVVAAADPVPELNIFAAPLPESISLERGNSLYVALLTGGADNAVSGTVELWLTKVEE